MLLLFVLLFVEEGYMWGNHQVNYIEHHLLYLSKIIFAFQAIVNPASLDKTPKLRFPDT